MKKQALNPYLPSYEYIPDGEPYVFLNRVYVFGSHDKFNGRLFCMNDYVCWSAPVDDLSDWKFEGVIYRRRQDPMNKLGLYHMYAPDVVKGLDDRYYLYYTLSFQSVIAVAVCDTPAGQYEFYGYIGYPNGDLLWNKSGDPILFDPGVFIDDDESIYLYSGFAPVKDLPAFVTGWKKRSCKGGYVIQLTTDMKTVIGEPKLLFPRLGQSTHTEFVGHEFLEASSIRKIKDTYYFIYSSINGHELCYATSNSPTGGFKFGGTIISNGDLYINGNSSDQGAYNYIGNNHGSIVEINHNWYVFHHRQTNRHHFSRQGLAEPITIKEDGSIPQVEMTSCGLNSGALEGSGEYEARIACHLMSKVGAGRYGVYFGSITFRNHPYFTQTGKDGEKSPTQYIANIRDGAVIGFKYFKIQGLKEIGIKTRGNPSGKMYISTNLINEPIGYITVTPSKQYKYHHSAVTIEDGIHSLYFTYQGRGHLDFLSFTLN